ncbi:hypothetical protein [Leucothrix pacifica]|uniref:Lipoprotein n=1 Tax=Leucothrix pacifica TaxID=1247513 RepID=A0A317C2J4_9GAMM|nr:hypothetical protein [Leucothrix pacifica]PWQ92896.1 hypothetical protein DKW60_18845 [Leucothrix pacifica]
MKAYSLPSLAMTAMCTLFLAGCGGQEDASPSASKAAPANSDSLSIFLTLHKQFCEKDFQNRDSLVKALEADSRFRPAPGFMGVFETKVDGISYAVSPEIDGCTTDVMVKNNATGKVLFSYDEMNQALLKSGYRVVGEESSRKDMGSDNQEVTILEKTFVSPKGETTNLDYPADRPDKYYMTLFAKKFSSAPTPSSLSLNKQ